MKRAPKFKTEADLCAAFLAWVQRQRPDIAAYAEWAGWDILLVYPEGWQIGIQAKLRLNAEVIGQAAPSIYDLEDERQMPDFRAVLVPERNGLADIAWRLGLVVFYPYREHWTRDGESGGHDFLPRLSNSDMQDWLDWNPKRRHELPPVPTDAIAGSPCPVTLTPWKIAALDVLAELAVKGSITTKRMRMLGVNPSRWLSCLWLMPGEARGLWIRGAKCPKLDEQHPSAYTLALDKARSSLPEPKEPTR